MLYIDMRVSTVNPMTEMWRLALKHGCDADLFGPGFVSHEILQQGLAAFMARHGPYDVLVMWDQLFLNRPRHYDPSTREPTYRRMFNYDFDMRESLKHVGKIQEDFENADGAIKVLKLTSDYYNMRPSIIGHLGEFEGYLIAYGKEFFSPLSDLPFLQHEEFAEHAHEGWHAFSHANRDRIISLPYFVSENEFSFAPLSARARDWAVLGAKYAARTTARAALRKGKLKPVGEFMLYPYAVIEWFGLANRTGGRANAWLRRWQRQVLASTRYSYTCGSGFAIPVRKFLEIPAMGAVLVCQPCNGFGDLGFIDGCNAVVCAPEDIVDAHHSLERDRDAAQEIADRARDLVWKQHSAAARGRQLAQSFEAIRSGTFAGSAWVDGVYTIMDARRTA